MFLALKEIRKEKVRSGLIIAMIVLIGYLIFILTGLALGLAHENTAAIKSWDAAKITLNADANVDMRQSFLTKAQAGKLTKSEAVIGETAVVAKAKGHKQLSATFLGVSSQQYIAKDLQLTSGRAVRQSHEVVADDSLKLSGYKLGSKLKLNDASKAYTIVGFTQNAKLNISPLIYGQLPDWRALRGLGPDMAASAVISKDADYDAGTTGSKTYSAATVIQKLPGYTAQNLTFALMIGFLMVISLIVIAVFLYILTLQKLPNYAVLRVQGVPRKVLVGATISQSLLLVAGGLIGATLLTVATAAIIPAAVPMAFDVPALTAVGVGLLVMAMLGGLIPVRRVLRVDPVSVIGG
ncbi:ABC transporter permease [Lacticaseibacillus baoqingensis]|uniref:Putative hemin transport system permease protein HrtB n=1 Tax=Lacticaseibacillus baoqingensis TaxID=2486013 RepID=A0ABW4E7B8_9LACO|nr:FtsX-like permease family protein [Lacticaseibacillus baoqingensis]